MVATPAYAVHSENLDIAPISGTAGAEITGIDFSMPPDAGQVRQIRDAIVKYKVLVFRDQVAATPHDLARMAACFGAPEVARHPVHPDFPGLPAVKVLASSKNDTSGTGYHRDDSWHTDGATRDSTRWYSFLHAIDIPPYGRDTLFADMEAVYDRLSAPTQEFIDKLIGINGWGDAGGDAGRKLKPVEHPAVAVCQDTGRKSLYVNKLYTQALKGMSRHESDEILRFFFTLTHPAEVQVRVRWTPGTIVMWDNHRTQHYLVQDLHDIEYRRIMHRVMVQY